MMELTLCGCNMFRCIKKVAKEILRECKSNRLPSEQS